MTEAEFHNSVASFLNTALHPVVFWTTFPAGGGGRFRGVRLKRAGLRPGVPDILVMHDGCTFGIELKTTKGSLSSDQKSCHMDLAIAGVPVTVARSIDDVMLALRGWGIPLRAKVAA